MTDLRELDELLRAEEGDAGCDSDAPIMDQYVEIELRGGPPGASATSSRSSAVRRVGGQRTHLSVGATPRRRTREELRP
jgi:hypothetical protein